VQAPAITNFIGTINDSGTGFLADPTGDRRFVVVRLEHIDWRYKGKVKMPQVWAQAKALYDRGENNDFTREELARIREIKDMFQYAPPIHNTLNEIIQLNQDSFVTTNMIIDELKNRGHTIGENNTPAIQKEIADWMTRRKTEGKKIERAQKRMHVPGRDETVPMRGWMGVALVKSVSAYNAVKPVMSYETVGAPIVEDNDA
jgi:predicted P-loop ATPase